MRQQFLASYLKIQLVFNLEKLSTAKEWLKYLCYLLIISLLIYELVLLIRTKNVDKGNSINNLFITE